MSERQSRSVTGRTILNQANIRRSGYINGEPSFLKSVETYARMETAEKAHDEGFRDFKHEEMVVSSVQFNADGDIVVYWTERFNVLKGA